MLIGDVDVIRAWADREWFLLQLLAVPSDQLISKLHVFRQASGTYITHLTQFNNVAFLRMIDGVGGWGC